MRQSGTHVHLPHRCAQWCPRVFRASQFSYGCLRTVKLNTQDHRGRYKPLHFWPFLIPIYVMSFFFCKQLQQQLPFVAPVFSVPLSHSRMLDVEVTSFAASLPGITRNLGYVASTRRVLVRGFLDFLMVGIVFVKGENVLSPILNRPDGLLLSLFLPHEFPMVLWHLTKPTWQDIHHADVGATSWFRRSGDLKPIESHWPGSAPKGTNGLVQSGSFFSLGVNIHPSESHFPVVKYPS